MTEIPPPPRRAPGVPRGIVAVVAAVVLAGVVVVVGGLAWLRATQQRQAVAVRQRVAVIQAQARALEAQAQAAQLSDEERRRLAELTADGPGDRASLVETIVLESLAERAVAAAFGPRDEALRGLCTERLVREIGAPEFERIRADLGAYVAAAPSSRSSQRAGSGPGARASLQFGVWFERGFAEARAELLFAEREGWRLTSLEVERREPDLHTPFPDAGETVPPWPENTTSHDGLRRRTCEVCKGVRFGRPGEPWQGFELRQGHVHLWSEGASSGLGHMLRDDTVVLLRRGDAVAAVRLRAQSIAPDTVESDWVLREDGGTQLDPSDPAVRSGSGKDGRWIRAGSIHVEWSGASGGTGCLYYAVAPGGVVRATDVRLCVTDRTDFAGLDAADPEWTFRASRTDPGSR